jgi:hypothetical protein
MFRAVSERAIHCLELRFKSDRGMAESNAIWISRDLAT